MKSLLSVGLCSVGVLLAVLCFQWEAQALPRDTAATGDACTIDLPSGLKKPGKVNKDGKCCSIWDSSECYDVAKSISSANAARRAGKAVATLGGSSGAAPTATPGSRRPVREGVNAGAASGSSGQSPSPTPSATPKRSK